MSQRCISALVAALASVLVAAHTAAIASADDRVLLGGGSPIIVIGAKNLACTLTAIGHDAAGDLVGLTAGHCGQRGDKVISETDQGAGALGVMEKTLSRPDIAVILFNPNRVIPSPTIDNLTIAALDRTPPPLNSWACKLGRTTGWTCGLVKDQDRSSHKAQICIAKGDSGAPLVIGNTLVGMVNLYYFDTPCAGAEGGTNIGAVLDAIGPGVGEGFELQPL
ncbi:MAG: S1 family peptidase [Segniliparus sp.]|uniref:S1 family peptidase n=1 Tax=Segniliparus sp. TaxID=2804064 RepID=UPI003F33393B